MSAVFKPNKGDRFYVSFNPREIVLNDFGGVFNDTKVVKQQDRSYFEDIFECIGSDDTLIVGRFLTRGISTTANNGTRSFRITDCTFSPVGPEVIEALGIGGES